MCRTVNIGLLRHVQILPKMPCNAQRPEKGRWASLGHRCPNDAHHYLSLKCTPYMFYVLNNTNRGCGVAVTHESGMLAWVGVGVGVVKIGQLVDFEFLSLWVITVISFFYLSRFFQLIWNNSDVLIPKMTPIFPCGQFFLLLSFNTLKKKCCTFIAGQCK